MTSRSKCVYSTVVLQALPVKSVNRTTIFFKCFLVGILSNWSVRLIIGPPIAMVENLFSCTNNTTYRYEPSPVKLKAPWFVLS